MIALADRLHKTISEIEEIPLTELNEWVAYFNFKEEQNGSTRR
jgi:hypothetical protein